jgi:hypothetical protein
VQWPAVERIASTDNRAFYVLVRGRDQSKDERLPAINTRPVRAFDSYT